MARIRSVKPELFLHEGLFDAEEETGLPVRLAFIGLWTQCDREGRFKWRPRRLAAAILPYDQVDFSRVLDALATRGFVEKYSVGRVDYGVIPSWTRHQVINNRESASEIPAPPQHAENNDELTRAPRVDDACPTESQSCKAEGKGRERKGKEGDNPPTPLSRGERLPADWSLPDDWLAWAVAEGIPKPSAEAEKFRDYWCAQPGQKGRKLDWLATWRNWCRNARDRQKPRDGPLNANGLGIPDLTNA